MLPRLLLLTALLGALCPGHASAQAQKIKLRAVCLAHSDGIREVFLLTGKPEAPELVPVPLYTSTYSDEIEATLPSNDLVFVTKSVDAEGVEKLKTVARGTTNGSKRQLAIFIPLANAPTPYKALVIDESETNFPLGTTLIFNLAPAPARFTIGEHGKELAPGKHGLVPKPTQVNAMNQCTVRLYYQLNNEWNMVSSTGWRVNDQMRSLALAYVHPRTKRATVNCFQEVPPWRLVAP